MNNKAFFMLSHGARAVVFALLFGSTAAHATYNYFDVMADPGTYGGVALGEDITLNACDSTFHRADGSPESYTLCQLTDVSEFSLGWVAWHDNESTWLGIYSDTIGGSDGGIEEGLTVATSTGDGTFFNEIGTYYIGLYVLVNSETYVPLPGGGWGATGNDDQLAYDGSTNYSFAWSSSFQVTEAMSVPEPAGAFLLLPALLYAARRERRRKRTALPISAG